MEAMDTILKEKLPAVHKGRKIIPEMVETLLQTADQKILKKALAQRSLREFVLSVEQLFEVSVQDQHFDGDNYIQLNDVDFWGVYEYSYGLKWCADNNQIFMNPPTNIQLTFRAPESAYYLIETRAARYNIYNYEAKWQLDGDSSTFNMDNRSVWDFDPGLPLIRYLDAGPHGFNFAGSLLVFESILLYKF